MILLKLGDEYKLYSHDSCIATTQESPHKRLSKENCDEIFGVVNLDKLVQDYMEQFKNPMLKNYRIGEAFNDGFNKAMEFNKDKLFTVEDIMKAFEAGYETLESEKTYNEHYDILIQSLQQPTEIEVEIEMEIVNTQFNPGATCIQDSTYISVTKKSKLDENGCLILKKK